MILFAAFHLRLERLGFREVESLACGVGVRPESGLLDLSEPMLREHSRVVVNDLHCGDGQVV